MTKTILICTVGGSHQPVRKAIEATRPDFVCFICTGRDPETGKQGSQVQITGKNNVISTGPSEPASLPNIPTLCNLSPKNFEICLVPADDLDAAFLKIRTAIFDLINRFPDARVIADYTGGTKSMTAALVTATLQIDGVDLQLVTGARAYLNKVANHTEYAITANLDNIRLERAMRPHLDAWSRYAYDEASEGLSTISTPSNADLRAHLGLARNLSRGFAAWERFDHKMALESLVPYRSRIGQLLKLHLMALEILNEEDNKRREPLQLYDLWLNAQRRAAQGRYDDAIARVYRLVEWTAQWQLCLHEGIDTANIPEEKIPQEVELSKNRDGKYQAGLYDSWMLVSYLLDNAAAAFFSDHRKALLNYLQIRNGSILAHGYSPIGKEKWHDTTAWIEQYFLPVLKELIHLDGELRFDLDRLQLPTQIPFPAPG